jgi:hypothetical protein
VVWGTTGMTHDAFMQSAEVVHSKTQMNQLMVSGLGEWRRERASRRGGCSETLDWHIVTDGRWEWQVGMCVSGAWEGREGV